jgi:hypothetical protein
MVGLWGAATTITAYLLAFGSLRLFILNMFVIGVLFRVVAWAVTERKGVGQPRGWWH